MPFSRDRKSKSLLRATILKTAILIRNLILSSKFSLVAIPRLPGNLLAKQRSTDLRVPQVDLRVHDGKKHLY